MEQDWVALMSKPIALFEKFEKIILSKKSFGEKKNCVK